MTKIWSEIAKLTEQYRNLEETVKYHSALFDWVSKFVIGSVLLAILALVIRSK